MPGAANLASAMPIFGGLWPDSRSRYAGVAIPTNISFSRARRKAADTDTGDAVPALAAIASLPGRSCEIANGDWDAMFRAVESRLRQTVGERPAVIAEPQPQPQDAAGRVQAVVLECVEALEQLHAALMLERDRCGQLERELAILTGSAARPLL